MKPFRSQVPFTTHVVEVCACALYLLSPLSLFGWPYLLDKVGLGQLRGLPALAVVPVAFAAAFGLFVLAQKARLRGERTRRRLIEQQVKLYEPSAALVDWAAKYSINARDDRVLGEFRDLLIRHNHLPTDTEAAYRKWVRDGIISFE